jgi:hypothetical protein
MADGVPDADEPARTVLRWNRGWCSYEGYQVVHESHMEALYREGIVVRDTLTYREARGSQRDSSV